VLTLLLFVVLQNRRSVYYIIKSTKNIPMTMLSSCTEAESIFFKKAATGEEHIYVLKRAESRKTHLHMEQKIAELDKGLMTVSGGDSTWFVSIGEEAHMNKVKSFGRGEIKNDYLFREIFDVDSRKVNGEYPLKAGVQKWSASLEREAEEEEEDAREEEDMRVQEEVMEADPGAFGGGVVLGGGSGGKQDELQKCKTRLVKQTANMDRLGEALRTRTLELEAMRKELVDLRLGASRVKEMEQWYHVKQMELDRERQRLGRVLAGSEMPGMDEAVAALRVEIVRVKAESEANVAGLVSIRERDAKIAALGEEAVKLTQRLENANRVAGEADSKVSIMEDVVAECGVARKEIRKRLKGVYTDVGELWEGKLSFLDEALGEMGEQKKKEGEKKKKLKTQTFVVRG
jgi:hypothetical protein